MNRHPWSGLALGLLVVVAGVVQAQDLSVPQKKAPLDLLSAIPADAWAAICIPNAARIDANIQKFAQRLNLPFPMTPPLGMLKGALGFFTGFDDNGGIAIVYLPSRNLTEVGSALALLIPTTDYDAMLAPLSPEAVGDGISKISLMNRPSYVAAYGRFALIAENQEIVKRMLQPGKSLRIQFNDHQAGKLSVDDVSLWMNFGAFLSSEELQQSGMIQMLQVMSGGQMDLETLKQFKNIQVGFRFETEGLNIGLYADGMPGTQIASAFQSAPSTGESLLKGLPADDYILAAGQISNKEQAEQAITMLDKLIINTVTLGHAEKGEQRTVLDDLSKPIHSLVRNARAVATSVSVLPPPAEQGMVGMLTVFTVERDADSVADDFGEIVKSIKEYFKDNENVAELVNALAFKRDAETIGSTKVHHLTITLPENADEGAKKILKTVLGPDGITIRFGAVDDTHVLITLGGGKARFALGVEHARMGKSPLGDTDGIQSVARIPDRELNSEMYLAVDRLVNLLGRIIPKDEQPMLLQMPDLKSPIAVESGPAGTAGSHADVYIPIEVIVAVKDMIMNGMGANMNAAPAAATPVQPES